jgi:serine/threonine protein kinase
MNAFLEYVPFEGSRKREEVADTLSTSPYEDTEVAEDRDGGAQRQSQSMLDEDTAPLTEAPNRGKRDNPFAVSEDTALPDVLPTPKAGVTIHDRYTVKSLLGDGAFGQVFQVQHKMLGQVFALKTLGSRIGRDPDIVAQFVAEAKATSLIGHENIVFVTDFGVCPTYGHYLVMEYLDGSSLENILDAQGTMDVETAVEVALSVGNALSAVHELGIVHRDLKPANVMRARKSNRYIWKVVDFGISTAVAKAGLTGTPAYMPPEQALGGEVDGRADQFALGVIIFQMLTGELPWVTRSWLDALGEERQKHGVPRIDDRRPDVPSAIADVVARAMSLDVEDRFESIEGFVAALKSASDHVHEPTMDPFDAPQTARHLQIELTEPEVDDSREEAFGPTLSVVTCISDLTVGVTFQSLGRFKREYRRNIVAGGLFVPTNHPLPVRSYALLEVSVSGYDHAAAFACTVVSNDDGSGDSPPGFGVALDDEALKQLHNLIQTLESGFDTSPEAPIRVRKRLDEVTEGLNAAQAFFLSRIDSQMTVGRARAMFAALPFDFEDTIQSLVVAGHIVVGDASDTEVTDNIPCKSKRFSPEDLATVMERASYFEAQHNYLGARELLEEAVRHAPDVAELHHRLARLQLRFEGNISGAFRSVTKAVELDPDNPEYQATDRLVRMIQRRRR